MSDLDPIINDFVKDLQASAGMTLEQAKAYALQWGVKVAQWKQQANAAALAGDTDLANSKLASIEQAKDGEILDLATFGVERTDATEKAVLAAVNKLIGAVA
jgi:hypothetical protein